MKSSKGFYLLGLMVSPSWGGQGGCAGILPALGRAEPLEMAAVTGVGSRCPGERLSSRARALITIEEGSAAQN